MKRFVVGFILFIVISVLAYIGYNVYLVSGPVIEGLDDFKSLSINKTITIKAKNIRSIEITINQDGNRSVILKDSPASRENTYTLEIRPKTLQLKNGTASVIVNARANIFKGIQHEIDSTIDTIPPVISVVSEPYQIFQGGTGFAVLKARDAESVFVRLEDERFPAFPVSTNEDVGGSKTYLVFFPVPFNIKQNSVFYAVAKDSAGNEDVKAIHTTLKMQAFRSSTLNIDDTFINSVVVPLLKDIKSEDPVKAFKTVNEEMRREGIGRLKDISRETENHILWDGAFIQLKNSKVMASYGDRRTYHYNDREIGESVHLGYDLASVANSPVTAANTGIVRFADELGIYGNTVIIDHGMGLMSLYGHLSEIMVKTGDSVSKATVIGRTGSTGFAGGDHLHFGILVHGHEVSPIYWWDEHWIKVNIKDKLQEQIR